MARTGSFHDFVVARSPQLHHSAWLLTGDAQHAEDLLQTVLATAWTRWDRINRDGGGEAYVRRALFTTYISWHRRRWWHETPSATPSSGTAVTPDFSDDSDARWALLSALRELPRAQRAVLVLRYFEDFTEAQAAELLGISVGTVKSHASRGIYRLRQRADLESIRRTVTDER